MPISIDEALQEEEVAFGTNKKIDREQLVQMLQSQAWSIAELAEHFGASKATVRQVIYKLKKEEGYNVQSRKVNGTAYYFISE